MSARGKTRPHPQRRVLHVDLGMEYRGGQRQVLYLAAEQVRAGMDVCVFSPRGAPILVLAERAGIPTRMLPAQYDFDPRNVASLVLACSRDAIIHTHDARGASLGALVSLLRQDACLVHTRRVSYELGRGWSRWKYRRGHCVICVSGEIETMARRAGVTRTRVISSAIPLERYSRRRLGGNSGRIGIIGALSPQKGHAQLFEALSRLSEIPEVWVVGSGELEPALRMLARQLGLKGGCTMEQLFFCMIVCLSVQT